AVSAFAPAYVIASASEMLVGEKTRLPSFGSFFQRSHASAFEPAATPPSSGNGLSGARGAGCTNFDALADAAASAVSPGGAGFLQLSQPRLPTPRLPTERSVAITLGTTTEGRAVRIGRAP